MTQAAVTQGPSQVTRGARAALRLSGCDWKDRCLQGRLSAPYSDAHLINERGKQVQFTQTESRRVVLCFVRLVTTQPDHLYEKERLCCSSVPPSAEVPAQLENSLQSRRCWHGRAAPGPTEECLAPGSPSRRLVATATGPLGGRKWAQPIGQHEARDAGGGARPGPGGMRAVWGGPGFAARPPRRLCPRQGEAILPAVPGGL